MNFREILNSFGSFIIFIIYICMRYQSSLLFNDDIRTLYHTIFYNLLFPSNLSSCVIQLSCFISRKKISSRVKFVAKITVASCCLVGA